MVKFGRSATECQRWVPSTLSTAGVGGPESAGCILWEEDQTSICRNQRHMQERSPSTWWLKGSASVVDENKPLSATPLPNLTITKRCSKAVKDSHKTVQRFSGDPEQCTHHGGPRT